MVNPVQLSQQMVYEKGHKTDRHTTGDRQTNQDRQTKQVGAETPRQNLLIIHLHVHTDRQMDRQTAAPRETSIMHQETVTEAHSRRGPWLVLWPVLPSTRGFDQEKGIVRERDGRIN